MDREYLLELAYILENTESHEVGDSRGTRYIQIEANTAKDIAARLRKIAGKMPTTVH